MISFHRPQEGNFVLSAIFCAIEEDNIDGLHRLLSMASIDINQTNQGKYAMNYQCTFNIFMKNIFILRLLDREYQEIQTLNSAQH